MKYLAHIFYGFLGAVAVLTVMGYLAAIANLGLSDWTAPIRKLLPFAAITSALIGLVASWLQSHGCFVALVTGFAALLGTAVAVMVQSPSAPGAELLLSSYAIGISIGVLIGWVMLGIGTFIARLLRRFFPEENIAT